jgi:hypothetical protein
MPSSCDSDAVTVAIDAESDVISAPSLPSRSAQRRNRAGPAPMTLGNAAKSGLWLTGWCRGCGHRVEPDPAPSSLDATVPTWQSSIGASGWSAPSAEQGAGFRRERD